MALSDIYKKASLVQIPSGYKSGTLYSVVPNTSAGDFIVTGDPQGKATRINKDGLIESVAADVPRLNYDPSNPQDPHLLLEPERTNQFTNSENLANIDFQTNSTVTTDNIIAPNGSLTADKTTQTSGGYLRETVSVSIGTTYSFSVFFKKGDLRYAVVRSLFSQNGVNPANSNNVFDLDNGSVIYTGTDVISASIEAYANDWYRCSFVSLASGASSASFIDFYFSSSSSGTQSSGTAGFGYGWGMQLEAGSYPTSYIPTTIAVTRAADNAQIASGAEDIIGSQNEGTLFIDLEIPYDTTSSDYFQFCISDGATTNDRVLINFRSQKADFQVFSGGSGVGFCDTPVTKNTRLKIAGSYKTNEFILYKNGSLADTIDTTGVIDFTTQMETLRFADFGNGLKFQAKVYQMMFFKEALTQDELQTLTT